MTSFLGLKDQTWFESLRATGGSSEELVIHYLRQPGEDALPGPRAIVKEGIA
jgi:hypothetical protein